MPKVPMVLMMAKVLLVHIDPKFMTAQTYSLIDVISIDSIMVVFNIIYYVVAQ